MRVILLGPPGSGKGTQGELIEEQYGLPKISTGDLLRSAVREGTSLGRKAEAVMNSGELVPDGLVLQIVAERISGKDCARGYVLDGFPRNVNQAVMLESLDGGRPEVALDFRLSEGKLIERLSSRRVCAACHRVTNLSLKPPLREGVCDTCGGELIRREDDRPEVIRERLKVYQRETEPLVEYYRRKGTYNRIDGEPAIRTVFEAVRSVLDAAFRKAEETGAVR